MDGKQLGIMNSEMANAIAQAKGLDLVEISPATKPPVCKIMDFGKYLYEMKKKSQIAKQHQKVINIKEIKIRPTIETHDYETKKKHVIGFLSDGDKVKVVIRFRGREAARPELGEKILTRLISDVAQFGKVEKQPLMEGKTLVMVISPQKAGGTNA